jgi:hypothetical protein
VMVGYRRFVSELVCSVLRATPLVAGAVGPAVDIVALLDAMVAAGLSEAIQDVVAAAAGDMTEVPLSAIRGLLRGAGVGAAAAARIVRQVVSVSPIVVCLVFFSASSAASAPPPPSAHRRRQRLRWFERRRPTPRRPLQLGPESRQKHSRPV